MGTTYTRQSSIADGDTITAALFNNEYNQLLNAFAYASSSTTGHQHDGTAAEGGNIHTIGDQDFLNKIVADSTNNRWGVFVEVSSAAVEQIRIADGVVSPVTDSDVDLGTSSLYFKNAYIDAITTTGAITSSSTMQGTTITATTAFVPDANAGAALGTTSLEFSNLFLSDSAVINFGNEQDITLTHTPDTGLTTNGTFQGTTITATTAFVPDANAGAALGTTSLEFSHLFLADSGAVQFGNEQDVTLTHVHNTGLLLNSTMALQFNDASQYINAPSATVLDINATDEIELNATLADINANVDVSGTLGVTGALTANAGVVVDNITIDGTEIDLSSGDLTIDVAGDIFLDAGGGTIRFKDGGTTIADITNNSSDLQIEAKVQDKDIEFLGDDGGSGITALTLDMSEAGAATFNNKVVATELDISGNADIDGTTNLDAVDIDGAVQIDSTVTVGVDDTGYDVKFFGATSGSYMLWDESGRDLGLFGDSSLFVAGNVDFNGDLDVDGTTNLDAVDIDGAVQIDGTVTVGVDGTGLDVKFFGATSGAYMLWDESADDLKLVGAAGFTVAGDIDVDGTTNLDAVDVDGAVNFAADVTYADGADIITASAGTSNFRAGVNAGNSIQSGGNYNVCVGDEAGTAITTGDNNIAIGYTALDATTTSSDNVAVGKGALTANTTGAANTGVGSLALTANDDTNYNSAFGNGALQTCTGGSNTAVGYAALNANETAANNVAVGVSALAANTTGTNNVAVGANALDANTTASNNTAFGDNALGVNVDGASNTAVGSGALVAMVDANYSTAIGADALQNATGGANTACGQGALNGVVAGIFNTGVGISAGNVISSGDNNLCLGRDAGIANSPGGAVTTGDNQICLGDENIANAHIQVDWTVASDERDKTDFTDLNLGLDFVKALEPVTYKWDKRSKYTEKGDDLDTITHDGTHKEDWLDVGFKAQAVEALEKAAGYAISDKTNLTTNLTEDGKQYGLQYSKFVPILVKAIQELSEKVQELESKSHNKCENEDK